MKTITVKLGGMSCQHCVRAVAKALAQVAGLSDIQVDLASQTATFSSEEATLDLTRIQAAIEAEGYEYLGVSGQ